MHVHVYLGLYLGPPITVIPHPAASLGLMIVSLFTGTRQIRVRLLFTAQTLRPLTSAWFRNVGLRSPPPPSPERILDDRRQTNNHTIKSFLNFTFQLQNIFSYAAILQPSQLNLSSCLEQPDRVHTGVTVVVVSPSSLPTRQLHS